jgi:hypothetical protein
MVQRKPKPPESREGGDAPSPFFIVLVSLFGYPGAGHLMLGKKRQGAFFAAAFTLATLGVLYEVWFLLPELLKLMRQAVDMQEALAIPQLPNLPRMGLWGLLSCGIWAGCGLHSGLLAHRAAQRASTSA